MEADSFDVKIDFTPDAPHPSVFHLPRLNNKVEACIFLTQAQLCALTNNLRIATTGCGVMTERG